MIAVALQCLTVMPGPVPGIHEHICKTGCMDRRDRPGDDGVRFKRNTQPPLTVEVVILTRQTLRPA